MQWKGGSVGYNAMHDWISRHFGKANKCEDSLCEKRSRSYQWANISGKYIRSREDFRMLCVACHRKFDYGRAKVKGESK